MPSGHINVPLAFQRLAGVTQWEHQQENEGRKKTEWRICLLGSPSAGLLPPHCALTRGPADLSVSRLCCFLLWPLQTQNTAAPAAPRPRELALSLVISSLPANTFVNSPLNKFSNYPIWVYHLFLVGLWLDTRLFIKIKIWETLTQRKSTCILQRLLWAPKPPRYPEKAMVRDGEWYHLPPHPPFPVLYQALVFSCYFNAEYSASTVFSNPADYKSHFLYVTEFHSNKTTEWFRYSIVLFEKKVFLLYMFPLNPRYSCPSIWGNCS